LHAEDFEPWIDNAEATRNGLTVAEYAAKVAAQWRNGLADWEQPVERIEMFRKAAEVAVYTPGSDAGRPLTVLKSFEAPPQAVRESSDLLRERTLSTVSGLLTLLGIDADPLRSREHILLSNIFEHAWQAGRDLDLTQLIREIQVPPFRQIGVMDLESVISESDRRALALNINNVLASPAFAKWMQGERVDIQKLLYTKEGKPRLAVISIAHLSEQERMFFVTILLNEFVTWVRAQPGTSSLRALLYMDEVFGYLPPTANPPSKIPLLTLLKQARAHGVGLVLATQNPVDLDYKALSNAGTWFLGRLQTERDKARMLDGLEGASTAAGVAFNRAQIERTLSALKSRTFLMNNVHDDEPVVIQTRWALSYLRGPLTLAQLKTLSAAQTPDADATRNIGSQIGSPSAVPMVAPDGTTTTSPVLPPEIRQRVFPVSREVPRSSSLVYRPALLITGKAHYVDAKQKIDLWENVGFLQVLEEDTVQKDPWDGSAQVELKQLRDSESEENARYAPLPSECQKVASFRTWATSGKNFFYRQLTLSIRYCPKLGLTSLPLEDDRDFRAKMAHAAREQRDLEMEKLRKKYETSISRLQEKVRKAQQRVEVEKQQASSATVSAAMTLGSSILGAIFGRKTVSAANAGRATSSYRAASRAMDQRSDIKRAQDNQEVAEEELNAMEAQFQKDLDQLKAAFDESQLTIETRTISPRKSDLTVDEVALVWLPYTIAGTGFAPGFSSEIYLESN
jgi:hypothetical protein